jgi:predicted ABC-type ATPase
MAPCIYVLAGTNGAGKSSVGGATFLEMGGEYFNPDTVARRIAAQDPGLSMAQVNSAAWQAGKRLLERAISERQTLAFETTLGGKTITRLLERAIKSGLEVRIWYVGLSGPELHIARVRARVAAGGHDIPDSKIRERYQSSRNNLIHLLRIATEVRVYDNSVENDPRLGKRPEPRLLLRMERGRLVERCELTHVPEWAKPIFVVAMRPRIERNQSEPV